MIQACENRKVTLREIGKYIAQITIAAIAYYAAGRLGQATTAIRSGNIGPVWPAFGVALSAVLLWGYRILPGIFVGVFFLDFLSPVPAFAALGQALGATLAATTGAFCLRRRAGMGFSFSRLRDTLEMIALGAFGSALISATIGVSVLYKTHVQGYSGIGAAWVIYWLGDATGGLLVTPLVLTSFSLLKVHPWKRRAELTVLLLLVTATSVAIFSDNILLPLKLDVLAFAVLPFIAWAAIRFGMAGASLSTFLVAVIATVDTGLGFGPFAQRAQFTNAVLLDVFFTVLAASGMTLAAVIAEREHARHERACLLHEQEIMEARIRFATIVEASDDAIIGTDAAGIVTSWNKGATDLYGYAGDEMIGQSIFLLILPERAGACTAMMKKVQAGVPVKHYETIRRKKDGTLIEVSTTCSPVFGVNGQIVGLSYIDRDITERTRQEAILRRSEERFRMAAHAGKMFAYEWDAATDVIVRSAESAEILGVDESVRLTGEQALGRVHPDERGKLKAALANLTPQKPYLQISYRILRPDNSEIWVERSSVAHFDTEGRVLKIVGMVADITERKRAEAALSKARLRVIEAQEKERSRIARELHDDIGQRLALLTAELAQLSRNTPQLPGEVRSYLEGLQRESAEIAADVQTLSREMHSARLDYLGLAGAARGFCREFGEKQGVHVDFNSHDLPASLPPDISLCLFRVLQEALNNSAKHSGAKSYQVRLWAQADGVHLTVIDSGTGFDSEAVQASKGLGLISMEERLQLVDGTLSIHSQPDRGTTIHALVPFNAARPALERRDKVGFTPASARLREG